MAQIDLKVILKRNVDELMRIRYGGPNKTRLGEDAGISLGGAQRVTSGTTNVGLDMLAALARWANVPAWRLLVPEQSRPPPEDADSTPVARDSARGAYHAVLADVAEQQLVELFRGLTEAQRDDLLMLARRWHHAAHGTEAPAERRKPRAAKISPEKK